MQRTGLYRGRELGREVAQFQESLDSVHVNAVQLILSKRDG